MTRFATLALALALIGCGNGSDDDTDPGVTAGGGGAAAGLSAQQQWVKDYGYLSCELVFDCVGGDNAQVQYDQCIESVDLSVTWWPEGICTLDEAAGEECLSWLETIDCDGFDEGEPDACELMWDCPD